MDTRLDRSFHISGGAQVALVLTGLASAERANERCKTDRVLLRRQRRVFTLQEAVAPSATLRALAVAVAVGLLLILPALFHLLRATKGSTSVDRNETISE
jgi:hypothetical protein